MTDFKFDLLKPEDSEKLSLLLYEGFPVPSGSSFYDDFPVWNPKIVNPARYQLGAWSGSRLVGSASLRFAEYVQGNKRHPIAMLGAVVTDQEYQKQGIASALVEKLCQEADRRGAHATMLWGSDLKFYSKFGFTSGGQQWRASLQPLALSAKPGADIREGWSPRIFDFFRERKSGVQYSSGDFAWLCQHKNVNWITRWEGGNPIAVIAIGRGIDLSNLVHEFMGRDSAILELLSFTARAVPKSEQLFHPRHILEYPFLAKLVAPIRETQFLIRKKDESFPVDDVWLTGMDSC